MVRQEKENTDESPQTISVDNVPFFNPEVIQNSWTSNGCSIVFSRRRPVFGSDINVVEQPVVEPVAVVQMSPQTAKDLYLLLRDSVQGYEKEWGEITTAFSRSRTDSNE